jgi:CHAT domain
VPTLMIRLEHAPPGDQLVIRGYQIRHGEHGWHEDGGPEKKLPRELPKVETPMGEQCLEELARSVLSVAGDPALSAAEIGRQLWHLITDGEVGDWWSAQIAAADAPVRTILDIRPADLRNLPWELMTPDRGRPVFRDTTNPWVRATPNWPPLDELAVPIQLLVVIGENGAAELEVDRELDAIHRCVRDKPGSWHVQVLSAPTLVELRRTYEDFDPHILHVIGHAAQRNGQHVLRMVPDEGDPWALTVEDIAELPTPAPRVVVLNCCRTSQAGAVAEPAWTFADAFLELGSAAVVTMQGDIPSFASIEFTSRFYQDLVAGAAIDAAAARARLGVSDLTRSRTDGRSWALPSLLVATDPDRVLPVRECLSPAELSVAPYLEVFGGVPDYVDRSAERRALLRVLDSEAEEDTRTLMLTGAHQDGRSAVLRSTLLTLRLRGRNTVYVDLDGARLACGRKLGWLRVLRLIRDAIWEWVPEIPTEPRRQFSHDLGYLIRYRDPEPWSSDLPESDDGAEFPSEGEDHREWIAKIVIAFRRMLVGASREHPLLLALDSLSAVHDEDLRDVLAEQLLLPLNAGRSRDGIDANVRCLTAASPDELTIIPAQFRRPLQRAGVEIKPFRREDVSRLVGEYLARHDLEPSPEVRRNLENVLREAGEATLKPGPFHEFLRASAGILR